MINNNISYKKAFCVNSRKLIVFQEKLLSITIMCEIIEIEICFFKYMQHAVR